MIIHSLLDTDLYKFTMAQVALHQFPGALVEYEFRCRNQPKLAVDLRDLAAEIRREVDHLCTLRFTEEELAYVASLRYVKSDFVDFLRLFQLRAAFVEVDASGPELAIRIKGPWLHTILFEVPILAIVSEIYHARTAPADALETGATRLAPKAAFLAKENQAGVRLRITDFGTRRRFSRAWQEAVVARFSGTPGFVGTSNVDLARRYNLTPVGTMAHEYLQAGQALGPRLRDSQSFMLDCWVHEYRGDLGTALTDVVGFDAFLADFDLYFAKLFDGCRHDSGDPFVWCEKLIAHYRKLRIDPRTKQAIFSDGLDLDIAKRLLGRFGEEIHVSFGIGTNLTNDVGVVAPQIVLKMTACNTQPVAKISDSPGKQMCRDEQYLGYLKKVFKIP